MNVLVIGNTSILGERVIDQLKKNNNLNIYTAGRRGNVDLLIDLENEELIEPNGFIFDQIIHCVASFNDDTIGGFIKNAKVNSIGSIKIVDLALKTKCKKIIYISSTSIYQHIDNEYYNSYAITKKHGGEYLKLLCQQHDIKLLELLPSQIYDEFSNQKKHQGLFYFIINQASKGNKLTIDGREDVNRNMIFIGDLVNVIEKCLFTDITGAYPCCSPINYKISEIVELVYREFNKKALYKFDETKVSLKKIYIPDNKNELYDLINYYPKIDLIQGINLIKQNSYETVGL